MQTVFIVFGASTFGILGTVHLVLTFFSNRFDAFDPAVTAAMKSCSPRLTKETTMWNAWIGFNASHSLGALLLAAIYIPLAVSYPEVLRGSTWLSILPVLAGLSYLLLAKKYWFKVPFFGILIATLSFVMALLFPPS